MNVEKKLSETAQGLFLGIKHRAIWLHLLLEAAEKQNVDIEKLTDEAIYYCGIQTSKEAQGDSPDAFIRHMTQPGPFAELFEKEVISLDQNCSIAHFHRCPLVDAWREYGLDEERIEYLCHHANKGDFGRASNFSDAILTFPKRIAAGDDYCEFYVTRKQLEK